MKKYHQVTDYVVGYRVTLNILIIRIHLLKHTGAGLRVEACRPVENTGRNFYSSFFSSSAGASSAAGASSSFFSPSSSAGFSSSPLASSEDSAGSLLGASSTSSSMSRFLPTAHEMNSLKRI